MALQGLSTGANRGVTRRARGGPLAAPAPRHSGGHMPRPSPHRARRTARRLIITLRSVERLTLTSSTSSRIKARAEHLAHRSRG